MLADVNFVGIVEMKLARSAFLYCKQFVENSYVCTCFQPLAVLSSIQLYNS